MKFGCFAYKLSIDEQMVPYFGSHSCKMYMKGKPVRFGFKVWCLCSSKSYLFNSILHVGKDEAFDKEMGLGAGVVFQLLDVVENPQEHEIYFDNFFTSRKLMIRLSERFLPREQYVNQGSFKASWTTARSCQSKNVVVTQQHLIR